MNGWVEDVSLPLRVATKYVNIAQNYYLSLNRQIDIIKLNGSIELAPILGLSDVIVDIVGNRYHAQGKRFERVQRDRAFERAPDRKPRELPVPRAPHRRNQGEIGGNRMIRILRSHEAAREEILSRGEARVPESVERDVREILAAVRAEGDAAVMAFNAKFGAPQQTALLATREEIEAGYAAVDEGLRGVLARAKENIEAFHRRQKREGFIASEREGIVLGQRILPIARAGLYVPGGTASYPSTVLNERDSGEDRGRAHHRDGHTSRPGRENRPGHFGGGEDRGRYYHREGRRRAGDRGPGLWHAERAPRG